MNPEKKAEYAAIVALANGDQTTLDTVYAGALAELAEQSIQSRLESKGNDLIVDLIIIQDIVEATAEVFGKAVQLVNADLLSVIERLPIDDIEEAFQLKRDGKLN